MAKAENDATPAGTKSVYPPILLLIVVGLLLYWATGYGETARQLPILVSIGTLILIVLDLFSRLHGKLGTLIRSALGAGFQNQEMTSKPRWQSEILQFIWVACCVASIAFIGILPTMPMFIFLYMVIQGRQKIIISVIISILVLLLIGLVFELLLGYELHRGILFDPSGRD